MSSTDPSRDRPDGTDGTDAGPLAPDGADVGLLAPGWADSPVEAATGDRALLQAMLDAEAALTRALGAPRAVCAEVGAAAQAARFDPRTLAVRARAGGNPVIPLVAGLTAAVGAEAAPWVHRGATSQDILDTAVMLVARRARVLILADLDTTAAALAGLAAEHRATPMPGRTLTQHAVPTTFGLKAAGWHSLVCDARARLAALPLPAQLGGAAGTLAALGGRIELLAAYAEQTGLDEPLLPWHVLRTPVAELGAALALVGGALAKIAADVLVLSRTEIGELAEGGGGGSSAMPHKANPVRATLVAAAGRRLPQHAAVLFASMAAEDERPSGAWHAEWQTLRDALRLAGGAARDTAEMTAGLRVHEHRMREHLDLTGGLVLSERLVAAFEPLAGRDRARALVSRVCGRAATEGIRLEDALAQEPELRGLLDGDALDGDAPGRERLDACLLEGGLLDGDALGGEVPGRERLDGDALEGGVLDGDVLDGDALGAEVPGRERLDGDALDGDALDGDTQGRYPPYRDRPGRGRLRELLDPARYLGAAPELTDRALRGTGAAGDPHRRRNR